MKLAFAVCNNFVLPDLMQILSECDIDYYTRWDEVKGKGHGTDPHLGTGSFGSTNSVLMIGFEDERPLEALTAEVIALNASPKRRDEQVRLFVLPLERIL